MSQKSQIVHLYDKIKSQQRNIERKPSKTPDERLAKLTAEVDHMQKVLDGYDERFARIAYWSNAKGIDLKALIEPLPLRNRNPEPRRNTKLS